MLYMASYSIIYYNSYIKKTHCANGIKGVLRCTAPRLYVTIRVNIYSIKGTS